MLFDLTTARLIAHKILLPGVTVLTRQIATVRERVAARLWRTLSGTVAAEQRVALAALLTVPPGSTRRVTVLEQVRRGQTTATSVSLNQALKRVVAIRDLGVHTLALPTVPPAQLDALARYAILTPAATIARMPDERRFATLLAFARAILTSAHDDALTVLDTLIDDLVRQARLTAQRTRLRTLKDLDAAALHLSAVCARLIDPAYADAAVRPAIYAEHAADTIAAAIMQVEALARPADTTAQPELIERYTLVRRFLPTLLRTLTFEATRAGQAVIEALVFLRAIEGQRDSDLHAAPRAVVPRGWRRFVLRSRYTVDRRAYTLCVLEQLQVALRRHDVFVTPSIQWGDVRTTLLQGAAWEAQRLNICRILDHPLTPEPALTTLAADLDLAFRRVAATLPANTAVETEQVDGKDHLRVDRLDKLAEPPSLLALRRRMTALLPRVDLAEALLEVHAHTGFLDEFTPLGGGLGRPPDLPISIGAVLLAAACNIGLEPLIRPDTPALTRRRLEWVQQTCVRAETLTQANARLVDAQTAIPLAQIWGGGAVASADGLRFVVPVRTVNAGPNPLYFGVERGATYYNFTSDQFTGFYGIVIPGALRETRRYLLDGLLEQQTSLEPTELITDTAGYSDLIFGLFWLLGYQFSPQLADIGETRFWRIDRQADYGPLNGVARQTVNTKLIATHWDDLLRIAGSLKLKTVRASIFIRALQAAQRTSTLARALAELGRIAKTRHLLAYIAEESFRRRVLTQLNRGEERHRLAREIFYGKRGELRQHYREGQEDQLGALGLLLNVVVLWNTWYMDRALTHLRATGSTVYDDDVMRLWPLESAHLNMLGHYTFSVPEAVAKGAFRPLLATEYEGDEP